LSSTQTKDGLNFVPLYLKFDLCGEIAAIIRTRQIHPNLRN
jgi:hypothetical protein